MKSFNDIIQIDNIADELLTPLQGIPIIKSTINPFLIVKPSSLPKISEIRNILINNDVLIDKELRIQNYEIIAKHIYNLTPNNIILYNILMANRLIYPNSYNKSYLFLLDQSIIKDYDNLTKVKYLIRYNLKTISITTEFEEKTRKITLNHVHTPDFRDLRYEFSILSHFIPEIQSKQN